jgi:hypothetical protein
VRRFSTLFLVSGITLLVASTVQAGPGFIYDWGPPGGDTVVGSDHGAYNLNIADEGKVAAGGSTDVIATELSLSAPAGSPQGTDAFTAKSFKLGVQIQDGAATGTLFFNVKFTTLVTANTTNTNPADVSITPVTTSTMVVNGDKYTITPTTFAFPGPLSSHKNGSIQFHINEQVGSGGGPTPPNDSPEPSTMLLAGIGSAVAGLMRWKKRRAMAV